MIFKVPTTASCSIVIVVVVTKVVALLTHLNKKPRTAEHDRETTLWGIARIFVTVFKMIVPAFLTTTDAVASISLPSLADRRAFPTADTEKRTRPIPNIERTVNKKENHEVNANIKGRYIRKRISDYKNEIHR